MKPYVRNWGTGWIDIYDPETEETTTITHNDLDFCDNFVNFCKCRGIDCEDYEKD